MKTDGVIISIDEKYGYVTIFWECETPQYKRQPCFGVSDHRIKYFTNKIVGDTIKLDL